MLGCSKGLLLCLLITALTLISNASAQDDEDTICVPYPRCLSTETRYIDSVVLRPSKGKLRDRIRPLGTRPSKNIPLRNKSTGGSGQSPPVTNKRQLDFIEERYNPFRLSYRCKCECGRLNSQVGNGFPWMVRVARLALNSNSGDRLDTICSGTLLNRKLVLTAAHCVSNHASTPRHLVVILGDDGKNKNSKESYLVVQVVEVIPHFSFDSSSLENDIALLKLLPSKIKYGSNIAPVCLPKQGVDTEGKKGVALAWGRKDLQTDQDVDSVAKLLPYDLVKATVGIRSGSRCKKESSNFTYTNITENMLCVDPNQESLSGPVCNGESGGPLLVRNKRLRYEIRGVSARFVGCGEYGYPTIFADVSKYIPWITENAGSNCITCQ